jgi:hypothetical protein
MYCESQSSLFILATVCARELITTLPSKSTSMCSVICILPICWDIVHLYLFLLQAKVIFATLDGAAPIGAGAWEIVGMVSMSETDNALAFVLCGAQVVQGLTVFVEVTGYLAIMAGVAAAMAS